MPYIYNKNADMAKVMQSKFISDLKSFNETMSKVNLETGYSAEKKQEFISGVMEDVNKACANYTAALKTVIRAFCDQVSLDLPEDALNYDAAIANTLKVIDLMGFNLTPEVLNEIVTPYKGSSKKIHMISNIIIEKNRNSIGDHYSPELIVAVDALSDGLGDSDIPDFLNAYDKIKALLNRDVLFDYYFSKHPYNYANPNTFVTEVDEKPIYDVLALPDVMNACGDMYRQLQVHYPQYFTKDLKAGA